MDQKARSVGLERVIDNSRNMLWDNLFHKMQFASGADFAAAIVGAPGYLEFFTTPPNDENLSNLAGSSGLPYDFGLDGFGFAVAHKDAYHDPADFSTYTLKSLLQEHGRIQCLVRGVTIYNGPCEFATLGIGLPAAVASTQLTDTIASETHGAAHKSNIWRPGGPDPEMGIMLREGQKFAMRLYLDQIGQNVVTALLAGDPPLWTVSALGVQIMCAAQGWAYRYLS